MNAVFGLLLTLFLGVFILIGSLIVFFTKNNDKFIKFSMGLAFGVMIMLVSFDLFPEVFHIFLEKYSLLKTILIVSILCFLGIFLLKLFDLFIPHHEHSSNKKHVEGHLEHIGFVSSIALILHNIIEGMALYSVVLNSLEMGLLLSLGIGLHNIPLGMIVASSFYHSNNNKKKTLFISLGLSISTFVGGLLMYLLSNIISEITVGVLLGITLGMIMYIALFELLRHILKEKDKKYCFLGTLFGVLIIIISLLFHHH